MLDKTTLNTLRLLAIHPIENLTQGADWRTLEERKGRLYPLRMETVLQVIAYTEKCGVHPRAWIPIKEINGKIYGLYARTLLQKILHNELIQELQEQELVTIYLENSSFLVDINRLAEASPVFNAMFFGVFKESHQNTFLLPETSEKAFQVFLTFLATQELENKELDDLAQLYYFADHYQVESFKNAIVQQLAQKYQISDIHAFHEEPFLFSQIISIKYRQQAKALSEEIFKIVANNENDPQLILTAKRALVGFINQTQVRFEQIAHGKSPAELLEWFGETLSDLECADFNFFPIENKELETVIKGTSRLKRLHLVKSPISGNALDLLKDCPNLESLNISWCMQLNPNGMDVLHYCPKLKSLSISGCSYFEENALNVLKHCPDLLSLDISCCRQFKTLDVLQHCRKLLKLDIAICSKLQKNALDVLEYCRDLMVLDMRDCTQFHEDSLDVLQNCPNFRTLNIKGCRQLKPNALDVLINYCPNMNMLERQGCDQLNMLEFHRKFPGILISYS